MVAIVFTISHDLRPSGFVQLPAHINPTVPFQPTQPVIRTSDRASSEKPWKYDDSNQYKGFRDFAQFIQANYGKGGYTYTEMGMTASTITAIHS